MPITATAIPEPVREVCAVLDKAGHRAWIVGGCVRDLLLGRPVVDWDIATSARPQQVQRAFKRVVPTGIDHGTVTVLWKGGQYEVTTLRGDGAYSDGRRPDSVAFVQDIDEDLARRDFTVNAIAFDPLSDQIADPHGGVRDLNDKLLRAVGDPLTRFREDGLRILRGARFVATLQFELEPATEAAFGAALDVFAKVSHERVRDEWLKAMLAPRPSRGFEVMRRTGILGRVCPELVEQYGCEQNSWHAYDVWRHTLEVVDAHPGGPVERMAALLHDIAKPRTRARSDKTNDWTFYNHETIGADIADRWLRDYRFSNDDRTLIVGLVRHHLICYSPEWTDAAVRRFIRRVGEEHLDALLRLGHADALGKGRPVDAELTSLQELRARVDAVLEAGNALSTRDLAVSGQDVVAALSGGPGPAVGDIMRQLLELVIEDPSLNTPQRLTPLIHELAPAAEARYKQEHRGKTTKSS